jgi:hypothetical protein
VRLQADPLPLPPTKRQLADEPQKTGAVTVRVRSV